MFARIVFLMLVAMLAIPVATLPRPTDTSPAPWADAVVAAKGKKHNKDKGKERKQPNAPQATTEPPLTAEPPAPIVTTVTRTIRQPLTLTFTSTGAITIPVGAPSATKGPATPYPSPIAVSGFANGTITDVNLILTDLTHSHHDDLDLLLSTSDGRSALVMSDAGDIWDQTDVDLILDDEATASMPKVDLTSGTYRPTNFVGFTVDTFAAPAPAPTGNLALSVFDGADPNGTWQLWVMDNNLGSHGNLGAWALQITAEVDVQVQEQVLISPEPQVPSNQVVPVPSDQDTKKGKKDSKKGKKNSKNGKKRKK